MAGLRHLPPGVDALRARFEKWRTAKKGRARIPPGLWSRAVALCGRHRLNLVSEWLILIHTALRSKPTTAVPAFVERIPEAAPPASLPSPAPREPQYGVEVEGGQGLSVRVRVRGAALSDLAALARLLGERTR